MLIAVIDTETTGNGEKDQVCEIAVVQIRRGQIFRRLSTVVKPTCSVTPQARAVHHITDKTLQFAQTMEEIKKKRHPVLDSIRSADYVAAHSAEFDFNMLAQSGFAEIRDKKMICTWRCSMHLWPDAPAHGNQVLRYWLDLSVPPVPQPPHRAMPDALATAVLLQEMLKQRALEKLHELTTAPLLLKKMRFGKYRGMEWREVRKIDRGYLSWIISKDFGPDEKYTAQHWLSKKKDEIDGEDSEVLSVR